MVDKAGIRREVLRKRDALAAVERENKNLSIKEKIFSLPEFQQSNVIFYFASFRSEVDTLGQIKDALARGKRVIVPKVDGKTKELNLYEIRGLSELKPGCMGYRSQISLMREWLILTTLTLW
ncbi:MAG: 5-formyltetrahydrofolate cyclo-ligase [Nitrospirota bacterium]